MSEYTTTPNYNLLKPNVNGDNDVWGDHVNENFDTLDNIIHGIDIRPAGGVTSWNTRTGDVTLTSGDVTTALTYTPYNATNPAGYQTAAQVSSAMPQPSSTLPLIDTSAAQVGTGTTWARADHQHPTDTTRVAKAGDTMTGGLGFGATFAASNIDLSRHVQLYTGYGLSATNGRMNLVMPAGGTIACNINNTDRFSVTPTAGTFTVPVVLPADPTTALQAATKQYVDAGDALKAPLASPTFTGTVTIPAGASIAGYAPLSAPVFTGDARAVTPAAGDNDTSIATTAFVQAAVAPTYDNVGRNLIHNPLFNVAQRGAGPFTANGYTLDRWRIFFASDTDSFSQFAMNDANRSQIGDEAANWMLLNTFTGNAAAGAQSVLFQYMEAVRRLSGKSVTVSFYAQAGTAGIKLGVSLDQNFGTGGSPSASVQGAGQSVTLSNVWARYSLTFALPSTSGKTVGTNGDDSTSLNIWYSSGATNATRAGNIGVQSGTVGIWGIQCEIGTVATPLEKPDPQQDLAKCQRFYQTGTWMVGNNLYGTAGYGVAMIQTLAQTMRVFPNVAITGTPTLTNCTGATLSAYADATHIQALVNVTATGQFIAYGTYSASADL